MKISYIYTQENNAKFQPSYLKMIFLSTLLSLPCIIGGITQSYTAVALPQMNLNLEDVSWFSSASGFASPFGGVLLSLLIDICGRKSSILLSVTSYFIGWLILSWNYSTYANIVGRMITGIPTGFVFYPVQVYIVECVTVNNPNLGSSFATWGSTVNAVGVSALFLMGPFFTFRQISACVAALALILLFLIYWFVPESPAWLLLHGRVEEAKQAEMKLGICQPILRDVQSAHTSKINKTQFKVNFSEIVNFFKKLVRKDVYASVTIMTMTAILSHSTGGSALIAYTVEIIGAVMPPGESTESNLSTSYKYSITIGIIILLARLLTSSTLHCLGVKKLALMGVCLQCTAYAMMAYASIANQSTWGLFYLNIVGLWLACFANNGGITFIPFDILSHVFSADTKAYASIPIIIANLTSAFVIKLHPYLYLYLSGYLYTLYIFISIIFAVFVLFFVPETVEKTSGKCSSLKKVEKLYT